MYNVIHKMTDIVNFCGDNDIPVNNHFMIHITQFRLAPTMIQFGIISNEEAEATLGGVVDGCIAISFLNFLGLFPRPHSDIESQNNDMMKLLADTFDGNAAVMEDILLSVELHGDNTTPEVYEPKMFTILASLIQTYIIDNYAESL